MPNWVLTEKSIYKLLKHPYQVDMSIATELDTAYEEFVVDLFSYLNKEDDNKEAIRKLNTTYVEFSTLKAMEKCSPTENDKLKLVFLDKLMTLVNREMDLVLHQMEFPKFFFSFDSGFESPFYLNQNVIKSIDIMEIIVGVFYIKDGIERHDHKPVSLKDFSRAFEKLFNIDIKDIYGKETNVIERKPTKITEFLDRMRAAIVQKSRDKGYYMD